MSKPTSDERRPKEPEKPDGCRSLLLPTVSLWEYEPDRRLVDEALGHKGKEADVDRKFERE